jgi:ATP-dependent protease ClpP protease subunit
MNDKLAEIAVECIFKARSLKKKRLTLLINSNGGFNTCLAAIKGAMIESGIQFTGLVMGNASSNAFHFLQQCHKRIAVTDAYMMFHWGYQRWDNHQLDALKSKIVFEVEVDVVVRAVFI